MGGRAETPRRTGAGEVSKAIPRHARKTNGLQTKPRQPNQQSQRRPHELERKREVGIAKEFRNAAQERPGPRLLRKQKEKRNQGVSAPEAARRPHGEEGPRRAPEGRGQTVPREDAQQVPPRPGVHQAEGHPDQATEHPGAERVQE